MTEEYIDQLIALHVRLATAIANKRVGYMVRNQEVANGGAAEESIAKEDLRDFLLDSQAYMENQKKIVTAVNEALTSEKSYEDDEATSNWGIGE